MGARRNEGDGKQVTMVDIARRCGVSVFTVSHALRGSVGEVGAETRKRIVAVAEDMGYDPSRNQAARRMVLQRHGLLPESKAVGLAMPLGVGHSTYFSRILDGALSIMAEHGYGLHVVTLGSLDDPLPMPCRTGEIDGLMSVYGATWFSFWARRMRNEPNYGNRPIVGLVDPVPGCSSVHADDYEAAYSVASHLLDLGHRYIVHAFDPSIAARYGAKISATDEYNKRLQGLERAYQDRGLDGGELSCSIETNTEGVFEPATILGLLNDRPRITAIVAPNDFAAVRLWKTLARAGIRIPEDISIVSFDDTDEILDSNGDNMLTTVRNPLSEIGQEGARLVLRAINGQVQNVQNIVLPAELIVRHSTAAARSRE